MTTITPDRINAALAADGCERLRDWHSIGPVQRAALETFLDALAEPQPYDQTALELCEVCGWRTLIPGEACLNCERQPKAEPQQEPVFWYRPRSDGMYEGPLHNAQIERVRKESGGWVPLYTSPQPQTQAARDILAERQRQVTAEGWTTAHDDDYRHRELAVAAACYAMCAGGHPEAGAHNWPWAARWWKPTTPRRDLVKAGALILAEIERLDRAQANTGDHPCQQA